MNVFQTSVSWWFLNVVLVTGSLLKSPQVSMTLLSILVDLKNAFYLNGLYLSSYFQVSLFYAFRRFSTSVSWLFSTRIWVTVNLQDTSQYSDRSFFCYSLDDIHSSSFFQVLQSLYQSFSVCTERSSYNWYFRHFHVLYFFSYLASSRYLFFRFLFVFFQL